MPLTPKNWNTFQHYKDRKPPWIKLHHGLLDDYQFACLPDASKALAPLLWLLASEYEEGKITASLLEIGFRLRMHEKQLAEALHPLIEQGFFHLDSEMLALCKQDAMPEKERETERETDIRAVASATRPDTFDEFWKVYPKRDGANPRAPARKKFRAAVKSGVDPPVIIEAAKRYCSEVQSKGQIGTPYVAQAVTWLGQHRWGDYPEPATNVVEMPGFYAQPESLELEAWDEYSRETKGKSLPRDARGGWRVPSQWPPERAECTV